MITIARNVRFDLKRGAGSSLEILFGKVTLTPTLNHTVGTSVVLPAPTSYDLINGVAIATNVAPSPAPVGGVASWAYKVVVKDNYGKAWEFLVGVPDGTTEINFNVLPRYFETRPPAFGQGEQGIPGSAATIAIGTTTSGTTPAVTNTGTSKDAILNFTLAQGPQGPPGTGVVLRDALFTDLPETYAAGVTVTNCTTVNGWPSNFVSAVTTRRFSGRTTQTLTNTAGTVVQIRTESPTNVWTPLRTYAFDTEATTSLNGLMSATDKAKLEGMTPAANSKTLTSAASTYQAGFTVLQVRAADGWPIPTTGTVVTQKTATGNGGVGQWLYAVEGGTPQYRVSDTAGNWLTFQTVTTEDFVESATGIVNVKHFGAAADGVTDDTEAIEAALDHAPPGATVFFPRGSYYAPVRPRLADGSGWISITKPVHLKGEAGTTFDGFAFWVQGGADPLRPLTTTAMVGDNIVNTTAHGLAQDDYVQMFTSYNAYTTDAGRFQMGSKNPTTGLTWDCRAGQITRVVRSTADQFETASRMLYDYRNSTSGQTQTIPGVPGSEYRRLTPLRGVVVEGITFLHNRAGSAKGWTIRLTQGMKFVDCRWEVGLPADGTTLVVTDSYGFKMSGCEVEHSFTQDTNSGSGANLILIGAGCSNVRIEDSLFTRGSQIIDIITNDIPQNPGTQNLITKSTLRSVSDVLISNNKFFDNVNAFTSHPATDGLVFEGNVIVGAGVGCHTRGRNTKIIGNSIESFIQGIGISAFAHNTQIVGNVLEQTDAQNAAPNGWTGVQISPFGVEIITHNKLENVNILGNTITARYGIGYPSYGVRISSNNANHPDVTDAQRIAQSDIAIIGNTMKECGIRLNEFIAGVRISKNEIRIVGGTLTAGCIRLGHNTAACQVVDNILTSTTSQLDVFGRDNTGSLTRPYDARHLIGNNTIIGTKNTSVTGEVRTFDRLGYVTLSGNTPSIPGPHAADTQKTVAVTFPQAFNTPPIVVLASNAVGVQGIPIEVTNTGFTASFRTTAAYNYNIGGQYTVTGFVV